MQFRFTFPRNHPARTAEMKVLKLSESYLTFCGLLLPQKANRMGKLQKMAINFVFITGFLYSFVFTTAFYVYPDGNSIPDAVNALFTISRGLTALILYIGIMSNIQNIRRLHSELQNIVNNGN